MRISDWSSDVCASDLEANDTIPLGRAAKGFFGFVVGVGAAAVGEAASSEAVELERRLIEIGFVEGAHVEVLHQGPIGGDPIAVRVDDATIALRRRAANLEIGRASCRARVCQYG